MRRQCEIRGCFSLGRPFPLRQHMIIRQRDPSRPLKPRILEQKTGRKSFTSASQTATAKDGIRVCDLPHFTRRLTGRALGFRVPKASHRLYRKAGRKRLKQTHGIVTTNTACSNTTQPFRLFSGGKKNRSSLKPRFLLKLQATDIWRPIFLSYLVNQGTHPGCISFDLLHGANAVLYYSGDRNQLEILPNVP